MDISSYQTLKGLGNISLTYVDGNNFTVTTKHFDPTTGTPASPTAEIVSISDLQAANTVDQTNIDIRNAIIVDAQALTPQ